MYDVINTQVFSERLNRAIKESKKSAKDILKETGLSRTSLSYYRTGRAMPRHDTMVALAKSLEVNVYWLSGSMEDKEIISKEEIDIIKLLRKLKPNERRRILETIDLLSKRRADLKSFER